MCGDCCYNLYFCLSSDFMISNYCHCDAFTTAQFIAKGFIWIWMGAYDRCVTRSHLRVCVCAMVATMVDVDDGGNGYDTFIVCDECVDKSSSIHWLYSIVERTQTHDETPEILYENKKRIEVLCIIHLKWRVKVSSIQEEKYTYCIPSHTVCDCMHTAYHTNIFHVCEMLTKHLAQTNLIDVHTHARARALKQQIMCPRAAHE